MKKIEKSLEINGRTLTLSTGHVAEQANAAIMAQYGETVVLATVVASDLKVDPGYFPLTVEYREPLYAGGRIKGSRWVKREGKPTDEEILSGRFIDRSIRPLFPEGYKKDVQVVLTALSVDFENPADMVAAIATSAALSISDIPWNGPVATVKVGLNGDKFILNPTEKELSESPMELVVSATKDAVVMVECGAKEVEEAKVLEAMDFAHTEIKKIISFIESFAKEIAPKKEVVAKKAIKKELEKKVKELVAGKVLSLAEKMAVKEVGYDAYDDLVAAVQDEFEGEEDKEQAKQVFEKVFKETIREGLFKGKRLDGRKTTEIRKLSSQVSVLPRIHGSAIFKRGKTQALSVATLGGPSLGQLIESAEGEEEKRYMHHYAMPPYSSGETGRYGAPSRREIGHGALAEKALLPVIPDKSEFPYTIRVVTEILSSNGSTSMASTCGSTLSLMDAGVPIKTMIGGIAMGILVKDKDNYVVLTDIAGIEDGNGDMDFKVAGSEKGITALQLDVKILDLTVAMLGAAFEQAKKARLEVLASMKKALDKPRSEVSNYAPKVQVVKIAKEKIGEVIGPGGKTIRALIQESGTDIDVDDDGNVTITGVNSDSVAAVATKIENMVREPEVGEIYDGTVVRIEPYGAFVEIFPGKDGLVHVSEMSSDFVKDPKEVVSMGQQVKVKVKKIDEMNRVDLTMNLDGKKNSNGGGDKGRREDSRRSGSRGRNQSSRGPRVRRDTPGGPHFPVSRFVKEKKYSR